MYVKCKYFAIFHHLITYSDKAVEKKMAIKAIWSHNVYNPGFKKEFENIYMMLVCIRILICR